MHEKTMLFYLLNNRNLDCLRCTQRDLELRPIQSYTFATKILRLATKIFADIKNLNIYNGNEHDVAQTK